MQCFTVLDIAAAFWNFLCRHLAFTTDLASSNPALITSRYFRLLVMSVLEMVCVMSLNSYNLFVNTARGLRPWTNWANVHSNFSRADRFHSNQLLPSFVRHMMLFWWTIPVSSFILFLFFGLGEEATKAYRKIWIVFR